VICLRYGSFHSQTVRVVLVRDNKPPTSDRDERGYGLPLVTTDLTSSVEDLVARYAAWWCIEVAFSDARQILGVGQARNRTRVAVQRPVPFGLICLSLTVLWYACAGHAPPTRPNTGHRHAGPPQNRAVVRRYDGQAPPRHHRREISAQAHHQATLKKPEPSSPPGPQPEHDRSEVRNTSSVRTCTNHEMAVLALSNHSEKPKKSHQFS